MLPPQWAVTTLVLFMTLAMCIYLVSSGGSAATSNECAMTYAAHVQKLSLHVPGLHMHMQVTGVQACSPVYPLLHPASCVTTQPGRISELQHQHSPVVGFWR